jgi:sugar (pentulose or hexulose) kinase
VLFLSIDFGTSSVKVSILDEGRNLLQTSKEDYPYILLPGEKVEIAPEALFEALRQAASRLDPRLAASVEMLCYCTFSPSPVLMRGDGSLCYPNIITHLDRRSRAQSGTILEKVGRERFLQITGFYPFAGGAGVMTLLWFMENEPDALADLHCFGHLPTYIHHRLTGEWMTDRVNASMTGLYDTVTQSGWSQELLDKLSIPSRWLAPIRQPGTVLGALLPRAASLLGLRPRIPVTAGTNDMAAAQAGAGNFTAGCIMDTAGSSDMVSILTDKPVVHPRYYLRNSALPGIWQIYATTAGGFALDWFREQFCREMSREHFYGDYLARVIDRWPREGEVIFDPYLTGDRQSMEKRTGAWHGLTLSATREEMLAAMLRSMNRVLYETIQEASKIQPLKDVIQLAGGMSDEKFIQLKMREIPGYRFEVVDNCSTLGNVALAQHFMNNGRK